MAVSVNGIPDVTESSKSDILVTFYGHYEMAMVRKQCSMRLLNAEKTILPLVSLLLLPLW